MAPATGKEAKAPAPERIRLSRKEDVVHVSRPIYAYRFLFTDGAVLNVESCDDDSTLRAALLKLRGIEGDAIAGSTRLGVVGWSNG